MWLEILFGIVLIFVLKWVFLSEKDKPVGIPGLKPESLDMGNLEEIGKAGSLHKFLLNLHGKYGKIASFWLGPHFVVSICDHKLFQELVTIFDRPPVLFKLFEPFIGPKSLQYANDENGKGRRKVYDRKMSHQAVSKYMSEFKQVSQELCKDLKEAKELGNLTHNFSLHSVKFALKAGLLAMFGNISDNSKIDEFYRNYQICWEEMESRLGGEIPSQDSEREANFQTALKSAKDFVREIVSERENMTFTNDNDRLIDILIGYCPDEETLLCDAITYIVGGFHTTANSLSWGFYYIASHKEVQDKVYAELHALIGGDDITLENISKCTYLRQVFDETLRCSILAPFAARVVEENDIVVGGYPIPAGTPIVQALGVSLRDEEVFPDPEIFNPDRFSKEKAKLLPKQSYQPFGVGKRMCPGHRFAIIEAAVCVATILREFEISLAQPELKIEHVFGFVTHPSHDIILKLEAR